MLTKTNAMFYLGAWFTAVAVRLFAYPFVGPHLADRLSFEAGLLFAVFAFQHGEASPLDFRAHATLGSRVVLLPRLSA